MARSSVQDPLDKFRFSVEWSSGSSDEGTILVKAGFHDIQMPKRTTNVINYREGVDPDINSKSAGLSSFEDIVMNRGITTDSSDEFYKWASAVHNPQQANIPGYGIEKEINPLATAEAYRKEITIKMYDRSGNVARAWVLLNSFPTGFIPGSDLNAAEDGEKSMEQLTLGYEDFYEVKVENGSIVLTPDDTMVSTSLSG